MLSINHLNQKLLMAQYAVRGRLVIRAQELENQGKDIIYCNIGNPHSFAQKPITYVREVLSLLEFPELLQKEQTTQLFHADSIRRAKMILEYIPEGIGAYSASAGISFIRKAVAEFIQRRDNIPTNPERIILSDGASSAAQMVMTAIIKNENDGILLPIPQYPMYSATLALLGGQSIAYYLDEENHWQLNEEALIHSYTQAKQQGITPIAITVINPGNPTGAVLSRANIQMIINFAQKNKLIILADEVYQENIYNKAFSFHSFAKVMHEMGINDVTLFSFHSMSKGYFGECGHRSGYLEARNINNETFAQFIKLQSINLCANVPGQIASYLMVTPPQVGDESYELFSHEKNHILGELQEKSIILGKHLNQIEGISVNIPDGAMYAFVKIQLPQPLCQVSDDGMPADEKYCLELLEKTGICVVPGSGFGQLPNTLHFRTTFLPPKHQILELVNKLAAFHQEYIDSALNLSLKL